MRQQPSALKTTHRERAHRTVLSQTAHLVIDAHLVERDVYGEGGGVVVRPQRRLLVRLVSHHEGQVKLSLQERRPVTAPVPSVPSRPRLSHWELGC